MVVESFWIIQSLTFEVDIQEGMSVQSMRTTHDKLGY